MSSTFTFSVPVPVFNVGGATPSTTLLGTPLSALGVASPQQAAATAVASLTAAVTAPLTAFASAGTILVNSLVTSLNAIGLGIFGAPFGTGISTPAAPGGFVF